MGARDNLRNANKVAMNAMNAVDSTLERFSNNTQNNTQDNTINANEPIKSNKDTNNNVKDDIEKRNNGRPAKYREPITRLSISMVKSKRAKVDIAALFYGGSTTDYVNALIDKDLAENYEQYEAQKAVLDRFQKK